MFEVVWFARSTIRGAGVGRQACTRARIPVYQQQII